MNLHHSMLSLVDDRGTLIASVTVPYGTYDLRQVPPGSVQYVNGGHVGAIVLEPKPQARVL